MLFFAKQCLLYFKNYSTDINDNAGLDYDDIGGNKDEGWNEDNNGEGVSCDWPNNFSEMFLCKMDNLISGGFSCDFAFSSGPQIPFCKHHMSTFFCPHIFFYALQYCLLHSNFHHNYHKKRHPSVMLKVSKLKIEIKN